MSSRSSVQHIKTQASQGPVTSLWSPKLRNSSCSWPSPLPQEGLDGHPPSHPFLKCMFCLLWPGDTLMGTGTPGGGMHSNCYSLCHWVPFWPPAICITKSSRASKDCHGRARTRGGFSSPSVGSRSPAPSSCESPSSSECSSHHWLLLLHMIGH